MASFNFGYLEHIGAQFFENGHAAGIDYDIARANFLELFEYVDYIGDGLVG